MYELPRQIQTDSSDSIHREYPSVAFANADHLLVADGHGNLYVLRLPESGPARLINSYELQIPESYSSAHRSPPFRLHHATETPEGQCVAVLSSKYYPSSPITKEKGKHPVVKFDIWAVTIDLEATSGGCWTEVDLLRGNHRYCTSPLHGISGAAKGREAVKAGERVGGKQGLGRGLL